MNNRVPRILPTTVLIGSLGLSFLVDKTLCAQTVQSAPHPTTLENDTALPSNPLLIIDPKGGTGNAALYYDRNGNIIQAPASSQPPSDYRTDPLVEDTTTRLKGLYLFGYDFFEPSRQLIDTRRRFLQQRYQTENSTQSNSGTQANSSIPGTIPGEGATTATPTTDTPIAGPNSSADTAQGTNAPSALTGATQNAGTGAALSTGTAPASGAAPGDASQPTAGATTTVTTAAPTIASAAVLQPNAQAGTISPYGTFAPYGSGSAYPGFLNQTAPTGLDTANAYQQVVDPLTQLYSNVAATLPPSYQISGGDTLTIDLSTPTQATTSSTVKVDAQGAVTVAGAGRVIVRGLTVTQAQTALQLRMRRYYQGAQVSITLKGLRTIPVTVSGEAYVPGTYVVPAVTTVFNILYAAGGPTKEGSFRVIEVRRQGKLLGRFDFYQFLLGKDTTGSLNLEPGDSIYIPPRLNHIAVRGQVRQPAIYELKDTETLTDALRFAGGAKTSAVGQHVQINTVDPGAARVLRDISLNDIGAVSKTPLYDGDVVDIFAIREILTNRVTIQGAVDQPGDYALAPGMHVSDLIERARGTLYNAYTTRADLYRSNDDSTQTLIHIDVDRALAHDPAYDLPLTRWDTLKIYTREQVAWSGYRQITVRGPVQRPGVYPLSNNMHLSDLLLMAGGVTPDAYLDRASLLHQKGDGTFIYDDVNLTETIHGDAAQDPVLQDNDVLAIYTTSQAHFQPDHVVTILGQVVTPGVYPRGEGMHLSDLLRRSGGFLPGALTHVKVAHAYRVLDAPHTNLKTASATFDAQGQALPNEDVVLQDGDVITVQGTGGFRDFVSIVTVTGSVNHPGPIALTSQMRMSDVIREAGGLRPEAFPEGVEFTRDPALLANSGQHDLAVVINRLNDLLNGDAYKRALALSDLDRAKAANQASSDSSSRWLD